LFGHVKGAFTGAAQNRDGLLSLAEGGTLFLDEIAEVPLPVQVKLLRVLEQNEVLPVGGNQAQKLNIRILAATHQDLERKVADGGPLLPDHFPAASGLAAGTPAEQLRRAVLAWLVERIQAASPDAPKDLYEELLNCMEPPLLDELMRRLQGNRWVAAQWLGL